MDLPPHDATPEGGAATEGMEWEYQGVLLAISRVSYARNSPPLTPPSPPRPPFLYPPHAGEQVALQGVQYGKGGTRAMHDVFDSVLLVGQVNKSTLDIKVLDAMNQPTRRVTAGHVYTKGVPQEDPATPDVSDVEVGRDIVVRRPHAQARTHARARAHTHANTQTPVE